MALNPFKPGPPDPKGGGRPLHPIQDPRTGEILTTKIRQLRQLAGWTQTVLAFKSNIEVSRMSRIERGLMTVGRKTQRRIAEALNVQVPDIFDSSRRAIFIQERIPGTNEKQSFEPPTRNRPKTKKTQTKESQQG